MLKSNVPKFVVTFAIMAIMAPAGLALAHGGSDKSDAKVNEFGVHILGDRDGSNDDKGDKANEDRNEDKAEHPNGDDNKKVERTLEGRHDNGKHLGWFKDHAKNDLKDMAFSGTVTAVSSTGFTFTAKDGSSVIVDTTGANIVRLPNATLNSEISVGDKVHVIGIKTNNNLDALVVYDFAANLKAAVAQGTVTAVWEDSITVKTDTDSTVTVKTNGDTKVLDANGAATTMADVNTNDHVKLFGFWDTILNVFNAIKIRLK